MKHHPLKLMLPFLLLALNLSAQDIDVTQDAETYNIIHLDVDTLPSLNIPRAGHSAICLDGQLTVFGGHTDGFIPTQTAEYFKDGAWHTVPLVYPQDHSIIIPLRSGKVFLAGGHHESLGIGLRYSAEIYDPSTNTSQGFGCLEKKRAFANAAELADGQIVISGNWHEKDGIEMFENIYDINCTNAIKVKDVTTGRAKPYILRISDDDAIIFSSLSNFHEPLDTIVIDRLKGESYQDPFFDTWVPLASIIVQRSLNQFIGDETEGRYEWLIPVYNPQTIQVAVAKVDGITMDNPKPTFSIFPLAQPLPKTIDGKDVIYSGIICDRERQIAYLIADNENANVLVFAFPYNSEDPAPLTIYQTAPQSILSHVVTPMLTPEGDLIFTGGNLNNNFISSNAVIRLPLGKINTTDNADTIGTDSESDGSFWWLLVVFLCLLVIGDIIWYYRKNSQRKNGAQNAVVLAINESETDNKTNSVPEMEAEAENSGNISLEKDYHENDSKTTEFDDEGKDEYNTVDESEPVESLEERIEPREEVLVNLFQRIEELMEQEQLYLNPNLKTSDMALRLKSNMKYVSAAINSQRGCSFTQFITNYRISYAQKLMLKEPDNKLTTISSLSGFTTESTFFRAFRSVTGMSPKEWLATQNGGVEQK